MKTRLKSKGKSKRCDLIRARPRHGHKYTKYKMCLRIMMVICIKEHLSNNWSSIHGQIKQHWGWVEKSVAYKKKACKQKQPFADVFQNSYLFLKIPHYSQEHTCIGISFLIKLQTFRPAILLKKRLQHSCFPVTVAKFLRTVFSIENLRRLLLTKTK